MNTRTYRHASAFTLIELLTVIAIIAILMALLFPAIGSVKETAKKTQAKADEKGIENAVKAYYTEYGKYPTVDVSGSTPGTPADTWVGDSTIVSGAPIKFDNSQLFNTLRNLTGVPNGDTHVTNPRQIVFFEGKSATNPDAPKGGFLDNTTNGGSSGASAKKKGCFFDPWGFEYCVIMDTDYDNQIDISKVYTDFAPHPDNSPKLGVGVFSVGKDGQVGSPAQGITNMYKQAAKTSDDVISWQ